MEDDGMEPESAARPVVCFAMADEAFRTAFDRPTLDRLDRFATVLRDDTDAPRRLQDFAAADPELLRGVDVLLTGWGAPHIDAEAMGRFDHLRAVVHAAGTVKGILDPFVWETGVVVSTAAESNAVPVAEFTLVTVILACKRFSRHVSHRASAALPGAGERADPHRVTRSADHRMTQS